jgi:hypothetical protein
MSDQAPTTWFHSNRYTPRPEHCGGALGHELWRITLNTETFYAYKIVMDPTALTVGDALILRSLGAAWSSKVARVIAPSNK